VTVKERVEQLEQEVADLKREVGAVKALLRILAENELPPATLEEQHRAMSDRTKSRPLGGRL
jgi:hypothetical protein